MHKASVSDSNTTLSSLNIWMRSERCFLDFLYPFYVEQVSGKKQFSYNDLYTCGAQKCSIGFFWNTLFT